MRNLTYQRNWQPTMAWLPIFLGVLINFLVNTIGWAISSAAETDMFYDLLGAVAHVTVVLIAWISSPVKDGRTTFVTFCVSLWAVRLGVFLFSRILSAGGDQRLAKYKDDPVKFGIVFFMQAVWVFFNTLPLITLDCASMGTPLGFLDYVGGLIFFAGFLIETIADEQKRQFRVNKANRGKFISTGLWKYSRHPNYFGEIVLWIGLAIVCSSAIDWTSFQVVVLLSPAFTILLLLKVSGIPLLEKTAKQRWGEEREYRQYVQNTSILIPMAPKARNDLGRR